MSPHLEMLNKLYTVDDLLGALPCPSSGRKPGRRLILQRARDLSACVDFGCTTYFTDRDILTIIESFRPCSSQSSEKVQNTGSRGAQSTADELSEAQAALEKAMQNASAGNSKMKNGSATVVSLPKNQPSQKP